MASTSSDPGHSKTDADIAQPRRNTAAPSTPAQDWPALARRCEELGITPRELELEEASIEERLTAIKTAQMNTKWQQKQRKKLRIRILRAIKEAEAVLAEPSRDVMDTEVVCSTTQAVTMRITQAVRDHPASEAFDAFDWDSGDDFVSDTEHRREIFDAAMQQWRLKLYGRTAEDFNDHETLLWSLDQLSDAERVHFHAWRRQRRLFMLLSTFEQWEDWQETHQAEFDTELLDHRVQAWSLNGMPAQPQIHTTTWGEFLEHCGGPQQPGESGAAYQARISETLSQRTEPLPPPPPSRHLDGQTDDYYDGGAEDIWCMSCNEERPGERGLSRVARDARGEPVRVFLRRCRRCDRGVDQL